MPPNRPIIDIQNKGIGDVVVACWLIHSAKAIGEQLRLNPRGRQAICHMFDVDEPYLTTATGNNWAKTDGLGHRYEYALAANDTAKARFHAWAESLGLSNLSAVRPPYHETAQDGAWAEQAWSAVATENQIKVAIFPDVAWLIRRWPVAYFMDLATSLKELDAAVIMVGPTKENINNLGCRWYAGYTLEKTTALMARADIVIGNDSGPAHLAGTIGTSTFVFTGPTNGQLVFSHDANVHCLALPTGQLDCHPCHFSVARGYRGACKIGGCRALLTLTPNLISEQICSAIQALQ